jgi:septum formation protein
MDVVVTRVTVVAMDVVVTRVTVVAMDVVVTRVTVVAMDVVVTRVTVVAMDVVVAVAAVAEVFAVAAVVTLVEDTAVFAVSGRRGISLGVVRRHDSSCAHARPRISARERGRAKGVDAIRLGSPLYPFSPGIDHGSIAAMHHRPTLVLASTSAYRAALLARLGLPFEAVAPDCDEDGVKAQGLSAEDLVRELARRKAESVAHRFPDALVIGSDQVAELDGEILGKPGTAERARSQLARLAGREHRLVTGVCLLGGTAEAPAGGGAGPNDGERHRLEALDIHRLRVRRLSPEQIHRYVAQDVPLDCAGSYKIEGQGIALFESIQGGDYTAIIGLPLTQVVALLASCGVEVP